MKIEIDQDRCVAGGQCVAVADDIFDQRDDDGVAFLIAEEIPDETLPRVQRAASLCPAQAIRILP
ncbi:ferredoxin [Microbacterium sp. AGC85]